MSSVPPIQDMPPQGGYSKINFKRVPAKKLFSGLTVIGAFLVIHVTAFYIKYHYSAPVLKKRKLEMRSSRLVTYPFLVAEMDRSALLQLRRNRDVEAELMKDVEGWEVGTLMGEPTYKTLAEGEWWQQQPYEYWAHSKREDLEQYNGAYFRR